MKPVYQQITDPDKGDCMRACVASILELAITDVPNWRAETDDMSPLINAWLAPRGLAFLALPWLGGDINTWHLTSYCIFGVPSQSFPGRSHAVVGLLKVLDAKNWRWDIVHDPNGTNKPYDRQTEPTRLYLLVSTGIAPEF